MHLIFPITNYTKITINMVYLPTQVYAGVEPTKR